MSIQQTYLIHNNEAFLHYYLTIYRPWHAGKDSFSHSLLKFKEGREPDLSGWIDCALELFGNVPVPGDTIVVRPLRHFETIITPTALDLLGKALAEEYHLHYYPQLLKKNSPTLPVKGLTRPQRKTLLHHLYLIDPVVANTLRQQAPRSFLIIDDLLTTGTTIKTIIDLLKRFYPKARLYIFTLARAEADYEAQQPDILKGQHYQLEQGMEWITAEEH